MTRYNGAKLSLSREKAEASSRVSTPRKKPSTWYDQLLPDQVAAADFILSRPATALFCKARTGKTYISLAVLEQSNWCVALIIAPKTTLGAVWRSKLATLDRTAIVSRPEELKAALAANPRGKHRLVLLTNPEALRRAARRIAKLPWDIVIIDESQGLKSRSSANSRLARRLRHVPRRIALSGTPIDTGQIDIWAQMRFVDYEVFGERWGDFAEEYCYRGGFKNKKWFFDERKHDKFLHCLKDHIFRLDDKFLGLRPLEITPVPIMMLGRQQRLYDQMQSDSLIRLDGVDIVGNNAGARDVKLSQITGGMVLDEDGLAHRTGRAKERKLSHLLKHVERPVVVFCQYLHEIEIIYELMTVILRRVAIIQGAVKETDRTRIIEDFHKGKYDGIICQVRTGGEGIDLTRSSTLIVYSMNYSYINWEQLLRRIQGLNQKKTPKALVLYCEDTIDMDKLRLVEEKSERSEQVLAHFTKGV
jgi:SNF2 family DNA or RNA helicase